MWPRWGSVVPRPGIHADPERGPERGRAAGGLGASFLLETLAVEVHRILHGPAHAERLHALECRCRCVVEMRDGPAQALDRRFPVDTLEDVEQLSDGAVVVPMHVERHAAP